MFVGSFAKLYFSHMSIKLLVSSLKKSRAKVMLLLLNNYKIGEVSSIFFKVMVRSVLKNRSAGEPHLNANLASFETIYTCVIFKL